MDKNLWYTHTHTHTHSGILVIKEWNIATYEYMDGSREYHAKWNKSAEKDKYCMISFIRVTKKSKQMNKHKKTEAEL